jgi:hypothetical protein
MAVVEVAPTPGRVSQAGPSGPSLPTERVVARTPIFVRVGGAEESKRWLIGEDTPDEGSVVLYLPGNVIPPEHRDLPTVPAVHRQGVWEPEGA